jgi:hypothetical protein
LASDALCHVAGANDGFAVFNGFILNQLALTPPKATFIVSLSSFAIMLFTLIGNALNETFKGDGKEGPPFCNALHSGSITTPRGLLPHPEPTVLSVILFLGGHAG